MAAVEQESVAFSTSSSLFQLAGTGHSGRSDVSERVDELLAEMYLAEGSG